MTEADWWKSTEPMLRLKFVEDSGKLSERKARLFAVAVCRRIWHLLTDERSRYAVELSEQYADAPFSEEKLDLASAAAEEAFEDALTDNEGRAVADDDPGPVAAEAASYASSPGPLEVERHLSVVARSAAEAAPGEPGHQVHLLRDIFGVSPQIDRAWLSMNGGTVKRLAEDAYEHRILPAGTLDADRLAVLADALEEAGCTDPDILGHLRQQGAVHVRGCFILDALLGMR